MASIGEVIYEDYLYKFTGRSKSILWGRSNPWKQKYFVIKRVGNKPVLEFFHKKPKTKTTVPKGKIDLWPSYRVEKILNMKNRAYVFQVTTPDITLCLSADEQRNMDMFVFFLQIQSRLKDQIQEDFYPVHPEMSEAHRRIGAKGTNCILHISPFGVTLALQSNRAVLGQWPLKSIRSYESSERGQLSIEAGRIAPMGDGLYIFHTDEGGDNLVYDLLDSYVMNTIGKVQPDRRGNQEEIEDYVMEAERLLSLTVVSACTTDNADVRNIVQSNWNTEIQSHNSVRPRQVVHTRLAPASSMASLSSQNSVSGPQSVPARMGLNTGSARNSPQVPRSLPAFQHSSSQGSRLGSSQSQPNIADRPPLPPPSTSIPTKILPGQPSGMSHDHYLKMNSSSFSDSTGTPSSPFTPPSADWVPPPAFRDAMRQKSRSPIAEDEARYTPDSYLSPVSPGGMITSTPNHKTGNRISVRDQYITPLPFIGEDKMNNSATGTADVKPKLLKQKSADVRPDNPPFSTGGRTRRLKSVSCEDLSDYLRSVVYDPVSKSMNDLLSVSEDEAENHDPEPFPRLQTFSGAPEYHGDHGIDNYYNIEGLKGKIYDAPGLTVGELRKKFSKRSQSTIRRSVSNPNFIGVLSKEKLHSVRVSAGLASSNKRSHNNHHHHHNHHQNHHSSSSSLVNLLPDTLKKHLSKDSSHKGSHGGLSSGTASSRNSSRASSRASSTQASPYSSLGRKHKTANKEDIVATTSVKGINITRRSRSFRKQKPQDGEKVQQGDKLTDNQSKQIKGDNLPNQGNGAIRNGKESEKESHINDDNVASLGNERSYKPPKVAAKPKVKDSKADLKKGHSDEDEMNTTTV